MTITVTPTVELSNVPPRVRLNISASAGETSVTVTRLDPDGKVRPVRTEDGAALPISGGIAVLYDYEAPYGQPVSYSSVAFPSTVSAEVTVNETRVWFIHPRVPVLSTPIELAKGSLAAEDWDVQQGTYWPVGAKFPIVHTDGQRKALSSSLTVLLNTLNDLAALRVVLQDAGILLLNIPVGMNLGVDTSYISVGRVRNARPSDIGSDPLRAVEMPFQVVDQPVGGTQSQRTWADVVASNATWSVVQSKYPTWAALLAGP